jgi:hypothetical protein
LLAQSGHFSVVTAYHLAHYGELVSNHLDGTEARARRDLAARFEALGVTDRMIDGVAVTPDLPEEYGYILSNRPTVRRVQPSARAQLNPASLPVFVELCRKIRLISNADRPVLLKSPWDYANFAYVRAALPDARFIFIHRNPIRVIDSKLRATRLVVGNRVAYVDIISDWYRTFWDRRRLRRHVVRLAFNSPLGWRITLSGVRRACDYYLAHAPLIPAEQRTELRYEDLCREPDVAIAKVLNALGMDAFAMDYRRQIQVRDRPLLPEVARHAKTIAGLLAPYFSRWGYTFDV